jgi:hypothetical protein
MLLGWTVAVVLAQTGLGFVTRTEPREVYLELVQLLAVLFEQYSLAAGAASSAVC